jgi:hypothetical protein
MRLVGHGVLKVSSTHIGNFVTIKTERRNRKQRIRNEYISRRKEKTVRKMDDVSRKSPP